jgi:small multidrug resistance pump
MLAILAEVAGTTAMKMSAGFIYVLPSIFIFVFYTLSFIFFAISLKRLELGLAYATWSGLGTLLISIIGIFIFSEPVTMLKIISLICIIIGVIGLKEP